MKSAFEKTIRSQAKTLGKKWNLKVMEVFTEEYESILNEDHSDFWSGTDEIFEEKLGYYPSIYAGVAEYGTDEINILIAAAQTDKGKVIYSVAAQNTITDKYKSCFCSFEKLSETVVKAKKFLKIK